MGSPSVLRMSFLDAVVQGRSDIVQSLLAAGVGSETYCLGDLPLWTACRLGHVEVVKCLVAAGADVTLCDGVALNLASSNGHHLVVEQLLSCTHSHESVPSSLYFAASNGYLLVVEQLLAAGADPWHLPLEFRPTASLMPFLRAAYVSRCNDETKRLWFAFNVRPRVRLFKILANIRYRLDHPPTQPLNLTSPTREQLIIHLRTAGRRFAREYWVEGVPLFFPYLAHGPVPDEFVFPRLH